MMPHSSTAQREPSMEEILASIRRIIEDSDTARRTVDDELPVAANAPSTSEVNKFREELRTKPMQIAQAEPAFFSAPERAAVATFPTAPEQETAPHEPDPDMEDGLISDEDFGPATMGEPDAPSAAENQNPKPAIISDVAGRQVAASFGELSDAFAATRRRSFDEIAEDMIRPMLQDWLDNNLPTLVERLVREEIERVARGAAR